MEKEKTTGLSRDFIIHPGETIAEVLEDREMNQKELALRTGMTEKHISTVVNGFKPISVVFAKKLEYALGIETNFWINLQSNYDKELFEFEEINNITQDEFSVLKKLKEVIAYWVDLGWVNKNANPSDCVIALRKIFCVSNLTDIPKLTYKAVYRIQEKNNTVDTYVLFAWQRMCEILTQKIKIADKTDLEKLKEKIPDIKKTMNVSGIEIQNQLEKIFSDCGIAFKIVKHFKGAPVHGYISKTKGSNMVLCMTIRNSYADIFWFTLFHEIAHILNGDIKNKFVDFEDNSMEIELKADKFAKNTLISSSKFEYFTTQKDFSLSSIKKFAKECEVSPYIIIGRLMKENFIGWDCYSDERLRYKWNLLA